MSDNNLPMVIKENKLDKIIISLFRFFLKDDYKLMYKADMLFKPKYNTPKKIVIPKPFKEI